MSTISHVLTSLYWGVALHYAGFDTQDDKALARIPHFISFS